MTSAPSLGLHRYAPKVEPIEFWLTYGSKGDLLHAGQANCPGAAGQSGGAFFTRSEARAMLAPVWGEDGSSPAARTCPYCL